MVTCELCGLATAHPIRDDAGRAFCCPACREVSALLARDPSAPLRSVHAKRAPRAITESTIALGGMWCTSCTWLIAETLRRAPGAQSADVSFAQRQARVAFDPARTSPREFVKRVKRIGYQAWLPGEKPDDEEESLFTRLMICLVFVMHDMIVSATIYAREWLGWATPEDAWITNIFYAMMLLGALPVLFLLGIPILRAGIAGLMQVKPNMHTLIAIGTFAAFGLSVYNFANGSNRVYFDTASMLLFLVALGRWFEIRAQKTGGRAVEQLAQKIPHTATRLTPDGEEQISPDKLKPGARVRVRPGERFPVDGLVALGEGDVDESLLTGESSPVAHRAGDKIFAGTISLDGAFEVITTATGAATVAGQIGKLLHQAMWQRAPVERLADRIAAIAVPLAVAIALGTFIFWNAIAGYEIALQNALAVLLIACPCALGIATPLALWVALGRAAEQGVLLRNTGALERLASTQKIFFDKTGTLTQKPFRLQAIASNGLAKEKFLARVAAVEQFSEHPLAQPIVDAARANGVERLRGNAISDEPAKPSSPHEFRVIPGQGVRGIVDGATIWIGNARLMREQNFALAADFANIANEWQAQGLNVIYAGWDGRVAGMLALGENIRADVVPTLARLRDLGLDVAVLTGDDARAGERWEKILGVPVYASQNPEDKLTRLRVSSNVAMVGDGINDGPALAAATIGIALADGTDVARAAADVILLGNNLRAVPFMIELAREAMRRVKQNLAWAFVYNIIGIALAVAGVLQPVVAALAMVLSSALVTGNALQLRRALK